ncbi:unnamed protein product [Urochloa decumbens]|uniref:Uncharacterized protein n=1 Tax=Urochloa decumbens TaxID=240449 RepID=A0ABC9E813_9POAL
MDPRFNGEWSASEIQMVKSLIVRHNNNKSYTSNMTKRHSDIIDELQAMFPLKESHQVTNLYIELMVEMMQPMQNGNLMNENFGMPVEDPATKNMEVLFGSLMMDMGAMRKEVEALQRHPTSQKQRQHTRRFWTKEEHRQFLYGLRACGRGNWKIISRNFVPNKTPVQISSHAQKYFRRIKNPNNKQRFSINDVGLDDAEPWVQNNVSYGEGIVFPGGANNPNNYGSMDKPTDMNNLSHISSTFLHNSGQESIIQTTTLASGHQQQMGASSSSMAPPMQGLGSDMAWTSEQEDFLVNQWLMNMHMN